MSPRHPAPAFTLALLLLGGCAMRGPPATLEPAVAEAAIVATAPDRPLQIVFQWRAMEGDALFSGQGVARVQPEYHARLDLFGPRGDTYLSAALVGADLRLPPGVQATQIPPPALMWAVLGVVAPPEGATLIGTREPPRAELWYDVDGSTLVYVLEAGRLRSVRWDGPGRRMVVELSGDAGPVLASEAIFRDFAAVTELMLNLEGVDEADTFPPEIWTPGG